MIPRTTCQGAFADAVRACDPAAHVHQALARLAVQPPIVGLAVGKAALAMARGVDAVARGLVITNADDGAGVPPHWRLMIASHPVPDDSSVAAGCAALALVESAGAGDTVLALISGGASALLELPERGVTLDQLVRRISELMANGAPIHELNRARTELSALKGGKLAQRTVAPVVTLVVSDVIGDDPRIIGSGPTVREGAHVEVIAPMSLFAEHVTLALAGRGIDAQRLADPIASSVADAAAALMGGPATLVAWGEPTVRLPADHGTGGRAQQLALELARHLRGTSRSAFVAGSDGIDGPSRAAGGYVDGGTWDAIAATGRSPDEALARCDATPALDAVGALVVTGPTGINHADVVIIG